MADPKGEVHQLSEFVGNGKVVLIDFWASWCPPCRKEMPHLVELYKQYKNKGFEIVGISLDSKPEAWAKGVKDLNITWTQLSDLKGWQNAGAALYGVNSIPHTVLVDKDGTIHGGPVYYITTAFKGGFGKFLAGFFAVAIILALGFMGCMVQSNSIGSTMQTAFGIPSWIVGIILVAICAFIFLGGVQRLASVTEKVVPIMAAIFLLGGLIVLIIRIKYVPATIGMIFKYAFQPQAIIGGGFGYAIKTAISQGAKRGLFSNEAGMGSTPHAHALANVDCPHDQGVVAMIGVFIDTFVVLTLNALVIISTLYTADGPLASGYVGDITGVLGKANLAQTAFGVVFGESAGNMFVAVCLFFFAFSTILSWNLFGKINVSYLFGKKSTVVYTVLALVFIFLGTMMSNDLVWELSDMFNNLMVIPNAVALFALTSLVVKHADDPNRIPGKK